MKISALTRKLYSAITVVVLALAAALSPLAYQTVFAGSLTNTTIQELGGASFASPMIANTGQSFALDFKTTAAAGSPTSMTINFNNFTGGTVNTTQTINSTGCTTYFPSASLIAGGSLSAAGSGTTITISNMTALSNSTEYCTILTSTSAVTNPASGGVYSALVTAGPDSKNAAFDVLAAGANAYSITGSISPTFTMALSGSSDSISTLTASALTVSTGITVTINTNAANGWNLYAMDTNAGLHSTNASHTIASVAGGSNTSFSTGASGPGNEAYGLGVSANATANYAYGAGSDHGSALSNTAFNKIATSATTASNVTQVLHELVNISATTSPATDYTDTITVIGAGQF